MVYLSESFDGPGLDVLILLIEGDDLRHRLWLEAVQPVEEVHKHFQGSLLATLHYSSLIRATYGPILERQGVVEEEQRSVFERLWERFLGEPPREGTPNIGEHEGNVIDQGFWEDCRQSGERVVHFDREARDDAVGEDENSVDRVKVLLNVCDNALLVELVLLNVASAGQPRCVEDANLRRRLHLLPTLKTLQLTNMPSLLITS